MANIALIVSTKKKRGRGHLVRCLNIRNKIDKNVIWFIDDEIKDLIPKNDLVIKRKKTSLKNILEFISMYNINLTVIDSYDLNSNLKKKISKKVKVITIEDKFVKINGCKVIYPHPINKNNNQGPDIYTGIEYAAINTKKKKYIEKFFYKKTKLNILINMGFYDSKGYTIRAIKAVIHLIKLIKIKIICDVFIGSSCPYLKDIKDIINENKCFRLFVDEKKIINLYSKFDIALGSLGMSFLERIQIGVPSIIIPQNEIQEKLARYWQRKDIAFVSDHNIKSILNSMVNLILCDNIRVSKVKKGQAILDGNGTYRVAKIIKDFDEDKISIF